MKNGITFVGKSVFFKGPILEFLCSMFTNFQGKVFQVGSINLFTLFPAWVYADLRFLSLQLALPSKDIINLFVRLRTKKSFSKFLTKSLATLFMRFVSIRCVTILDYKNYVLNAVLCRHKPFFCFSYLSI